MMRGKGLKDLTAPMSPRPPISQDDALTRRVIGVFFVVYNRLGYGFVESVYARAMELELLRQGFCVAREAAVEVRWGAELLGHFRADMIVNDAIILEFKAGPRLVPADYLQLLNYLRSSRMQVGLLLHFGPQPRIRRVEGPG